MGTISLRLSLHPRCALWLEVSLLEMVHPGHSLHSTLHRQLCVWSACACPAIPAYGQESCPSWIRTALDERIVCRIRSSNSHWKPNLWLVCRSIYLETIPTITRVASHGGGNGTAWSWSIGLDPPCVSHSTRIFRIHSLDRGLGSHRRYSRQGRTRHMDGHGTLQQQCWSCH